MDLKSVLSSKEFEDIKNTLEAYFEKHPKATLGVAFIAGIALSQPAVWRIAARLAVGSQAFLWRDKLTKIAIDAAKSAQKSVSKAPDSVSLPH